MFCTTFKLFCIKIVNKTVKFYHINCPRPKQCIEKPDHGNKKNDHFIVVLMTFTGKEGEGGRGDITSDVLDFRKTIEFL